MNIEPQPDSPSGSADARQFRYSLRDLFVFVTCLAVLLGIGRWLLIGFQAARRSARQQTSGNDLKQIGLAVVNYHQSFRRLPPLYAADPQGRPLYSWRVLVIPYLYSNWITVPAPAKPWNSPQNASLANLSIACFHAPDDDTPSTMTSYVAITGPHTAWPGDKGTRFDDFKSPGKTILLVELQNSGINWTEPRDLDISELAKLTANRHAGDFHAFFADGHVELLPADIDLKKLAAMCDPDTRPP
jgi:prepilin-type processing-associated H-X9-DG protein